MDNTMVRAGGIARFSRKRLTHGHENGWAWEQVCRPLFDDAWYLSHHPDVAAHATDAFRHFMDYGWKEGRDPNPLFSLSWYTRRNPDIAAAGLNPLVHYAMFGAREGRSPHPIFDHSWYVERYAGSMKPGDNPLSDYLRHGPTSDRAPNSAFDASWYRDAYPAALEYATLAHHFVEQAPDERRPSAGFDPKVYSRLHMDGRVHGMDPLEHHIQHRYDLPKTASAPAVNHRVAVIFLARSGDGSTAEFDRFFRSYQRHPAGLDHDLIVVRKGAARKSGAREAIALFVGATPVQYIDIEDDGYDIQAYLRISAILKHDIICCLNTFSEILAPGWLAKLTAPLDDPSVGVAGASASYESISDSVELGFKVVWLSANKIGSVPTDVAHAFKSTLDRNVAGWVERLRTIAYDGDLEKLERERKLTDLDLEVAYETTWERSKTDGFLRDMNVFRRFPNPHMRSNGFVVRRKQFVDFDFTLEDTKIACVNFESGPDGFPTRLAKTGLKAVLVGADGRVFDVPDWAKSGTFRLGEQDNLLIGDNRTREFAGLTTPERNALVRMTWGDYAEASDDPPGRMGFRFRRGNLDLGNAPRIGTRRLNLMERGRASGSAASPKISVVIPSRNRLALVKDAITSVCRQDYDHWECIAFDNYSDEPVEDHVRAIGDSRLIYGRSETFLPVTESWNRAIDLATGDYVILIGDDDGLLPHFCTDLAKTIDRFHEPEFIYSALYQFCHPGVAPWEPSGYVDEVKAGFFFQGRTDEFVLTDRARMLAIKGSLMCRRNFLYNMQSLVFKRSFLDRLRRNGKVFHSPFPDYYIANYAMDRAIDVVVKPKPTTVAGVSRKSFGFTLFNNDPQKGASLLNTKLIDDHVFKTLKDRLLPGSDYRTSYLITMGHLVDALGSRNAVELDIDRYRQQQILGYMEDNRERPGWWADFERDMAPLLDAVELSQAEIIADLALRTDRGDEDARRSLDVIRERTSLYGPYQEVTEVRRLDTGGYANLIELLDRGIEL